MATTVARLEAVLSANTRDFDRGMDRSQGKMHKVGRAAGVMGGLLAGALVIGMKKSVDAAMDAERSQSRLEAAFKGAKVSIDPYRKSMEAASKAALKLGFDDEDLQDSIGSLIIATGSYKKAQEAANVAMDLARFKNVSLEQATKMLTMAQAGSQRATKQLGISVVPVTAAYDKLKEQFGSHISASEKVALAQAKLNDKQATAALVLDTVSGKVHGQAAAYADTAAGGMEQFKVQMEEVQENLGKTLLPALVKVTGALVVMLGWLQQHPKAVKALTIALGALAAALLAAAAAQTAMNLAVLANPYVAAAVSVAALSAAMYVLWQRGGAARDVVIALATKLSPLGAAILLINEHLVSLSGVLSSIKRAFQWIIDKAGAIGGAFGKIGAAAGWLKDKVGDPANPNMLLPPASGRGVGRGAGGLQPGILDELAGGRAMGLYLASGVRSPAENARVGGAPNSDHLYGRAIDMAGPAANMARFFNWLIGQRDVKQAFYDPLGSIFGGVLSSYREGGHSDHVHVATADSGYLNLRRGWNMVGNFTGRNEPMHAGGGFNEREIKLILDGKVLASWMQNWSQQFKQQNGRTAFG